MHGFSGCAPNVWQWSKIKPLLTVHGDLIQPLPARVHIEVISPESSADYVFIRLIKPFEGLVSPPSPCLKARSGEMHGLEEGLDP